MTQTDTSPDAKYRKTLLDYYEEEVMGEAYFYGLCDHFDGESEREKLRLLAEVETCAARSVEPLLKKHGLEPRDSEVLRSLGVKDVAAHKDLSWHEFVTHMAVRYPGYIDDFEALERMAPDEDLPCLKQLTRHEVVAIEFAEMEVAGKPGSTAPLADYIAECEKLAPT